MEMNKRTFCFLALLLTGCLPSLHPLYNDETLIFRQELIGKWSKIEWMEDHSAFWQFRQAGEKEYELRIHDDEAVEHGRFSAHLIEIEGLMFLDIFPDSKPLEDLDDFYQIHILPVHTFMKVDQINPNLQLRMIDYEKMEEILENDPNSLKHEIVDDRIVLTARTEELQNFVIKHVETIFAETSDDKDDDSSGAIRLEPLYIEEDIIVDPNFVGQWKVEDGGVLSSKRGSEKTYDLMFIENDGTKHEVFANLIHHNGNVFMAVFFDKAELDPDKPYAYSFHLIPDLFFRVQKTESELILHEMDYKEASQILRDNISPAKPQQSDDSYLFKGTRIEP
jgi:hypothetical protein